MRRSDWLTFSAVILIIAGILRVIDAIWAFGYHGALPDGLQGALPGHSLTTYGWIWLIAGVILITSGALLFGPSDRPSAEIARWVGIIAASLGAISAAFVLPYYPVWSLLYIIIAVMVVYGLSAHYDQKTA
jgi:magnesium-transporting ATPase (P-type)